VDDLDLGWCQAFRPVAEVLSKHYWRMALSGLEHLPAEGPAVLVCNHGGLLPWDALVLAHRLAWQDRPGRQVRPVLDDDMLRLPLLGPALRRLGAVAAGSVWPERLLQEGAVLLLFPETARVGGRPIWHRYRVHPWGRGWFVRMAARAGAPLIPTAIVGSEEAFPVLARLGWPARRVGLPPLPITPTFPWLGPLGLLPLPSKWSVRLGPPLANLAQRLEGEEPTASQDVSEELRARLQAMLREDVEARRSVLRG
jgi:1-acyl-sn-glycerol-3-phosphate acyltransferase